MPIPIGNESAAAKPRARWKVWLKRLVCGVAALVVGMVLLAVLAVLFENWRGRRAWEAYRKEAEARGVKLDIASFIPPLIPDESNVAAIPMFAALFDYERIPPGPGEWTRYGYRYETVNWDSGIRWRDSNTVNRVKMIGEAFHAMSLGDTAWPWAVRVNLADIEQKVLKLTKEFPALRKQPSPAQTLLAATAKFDGVVAELEEGFKRKSARFPIRYDEAGDDGFEHLGVLRNFARLASLKSSAYLAEGRYPEAFTQVLFGLRCGEVSGVDPLLASAYSKFVIDCQSISGVYEGIINHQWSPDQLREFETILARAAPLVEMDKTFQCARALRNDLIDHLRSGSVPSEIFDGEGFTTRTWSLPSAVWYRNQLWSNRYYDTIDMRSVRTQGLSVLSDAERFSNRRDAFWPYDVLARMSAPTWLFYVKAAVRARVTLDLAILACALERHRLAKGIYPEVLEELVPEFTRAIPNDAASAGALHYRREGGDQFVLYSVGADLKDDNGRIPHSDTGDWVWRWPAVGK